MGGKLMARACPMERGGGEAKVGAQASLQGGGERNAL